MKQRPGFAVRAVRRLAELYAGVPTGSSDFEVLHDLTTTMSDGVVLLGDLYRPAGVQTGPVVVIRTPYGRATPGSRLFGVVLARHGFPVLLQSVRGTFGSGGVFRPFTTEHQDGLDTLSWVRAQPWCDGRVATTGGSYFGHTQWAVAPYADPPLVSSSLHITAASISDVFYEHGAPGALNAISWSDLITRQELTGVVPRIQSAGRRFRVTKALGTKPLRDADIAATGVPVLFWRDVVEHDQPDDPFWEVADHDRADLGRMPPVNMVTGWWDLFLQAQLHDVTRLQEAGVPVRLTVGPWLHGAMPEIRELLRTDLVQLEHLLHDGPAPEGRPIRLHLQQADEWLAFERWPPEDARVEQRFLLEGDVLGREAGPAAAAPSRFTFDPEDPTVLLGGPLLAPPGKQVDDRGAEAGVDVLVFTGPQEPADLDVVGPVTARIHVRPSAEHADVVVRLCDVAPDGVSRNVVDGVRRLDPRTVPADDVAVGDDGVLAVDVELFPTAYRFEAGHRLRVVIAGGASPRFAPNIGRDGRTGDSPPTTPCRFEVFHDAAHPSALTLSVVH